MDSLRPYGNVDDGASTRTGSPNSTPPSEPDAAEHATATEVLSSFVADDIEEQIRRSASKLDETTLQPIGPRVIYHLEQQARKVAESINDTLQWLQTEMCRKTDLTRQNVQVYQTSIVTTCESAETLVKTAYQLMAKTEELMIGLQPTQQLAAQVAEIKKTLTILEAQLPP